MHTPWEYAGPIAAARLGVPLVRHTWGVALPPELTPVEAEVLVITGGGALDPGTVPANAEVIDWVPLNQVLRVCDAVVHHGGSGTTMTSLHAGLPQLALPQMCDWP